MKLKIILGVLAIGILLGISNQEFIFSVLADVITKIYLADYIVADYDIDNINYYLQIEVDDKRY